jgi:hypothetical protein
MSFGQASKALFKLKGCSNVPVWIAIEELLMRIGYEVNPPCISILGIIETIIEFINANYTHTNVIVKNIPYEETRNNLMGVRYEWTDDRQIIMGIYIETPWKWAEFHAMMATVMPMILAVKHPAAITVDCSRLGALPKDGNFIHILMNIEKHMAANIFASAVVAAPQAVMVFMNIVMKLRPNPNILTLFTPTMTEAHEKIYARHQERYADSSKAQ